MLITAFLEDGAINSWEALGPLVGSDTEVTILTVRAATVTSVLFTFGRLGFLSRYWIVFSYSIFWGVSVCMFLCVCTHICAYVCGAYPCMSECVWEPEADVGSHPWSFTLFIEMDCSSELSNNCAALTSSGRPLSREIFRS